MRDYLRCIASVDRNVGRVLDYLEQKGLLENTVVVYTSDQGFYMGEHGWFDKRFMYEESMRTPLLVYYPEGVRGDIDLAVQNIDYAPTFAQIAGLDVPEDMHGLSLLPLLKGEESPCWRDGVYYHYYEYPAEHAVRKHFGIRTDRYKLIRFYSDSTDAARVGRAWLKDKEKALKEVNEWELYDLQEDPSEMNNIYGQEGTEELVADLKRRLKALQAQYGESHFWRD
jgi:arylsulfatase A-like enzyme